MNIALLSPNQNAYSETFIQAHKNLLKEQVFYYHGGISNMKLEGHSSFTQTNKSLILKVKRRLYHKPFSYINEELLLQSLKKNKIDAILVEYGTHAQRLLPVLRKSRLPFVVHFHGFDASVLKVIKSNQNYQEVFKSSNFVVVVSRKMHRDLLKMGCPEEKLVYNVYGPQDKFFGVKPKFSKQQFISVGRFVDKKAPYYTILSFLQVVEKFPEAKLIMAGEGQLLNTCKNLVKFYKMEANITFIGVITAEKYMEYMEESLAFVQHSIMADNGDSEGTPVGIMEASVAGLPVISTNHAGIPDVIIHGETGLLVKEHDVDEMAKNMIMLLENKETAKKMGAKGKINIKENFNMERHISLLDELIYKAVKINSGI